jgi:hypothetical protein
MQGVRAELVNHLGDFVDRYDVDDLKRFSPVKRHAMVACFLLEAHRTILDHIVEMHRQFVTGMRRRARHVARPRSAWTNGSKTCVSNAGSIP